MSNTTIAHAPATSVLPVAPPARHETLSVISFLFAFLGLWFVAIPLGHVARRRARKHSTSTAFATAALVVGYLSAAVIAVVLIWFAIAFATLPQ
ncbi:DUF4190 domain-containing protein [Leucobacter chromiireducens]|uniref:DUF4190 domain-containing protein n=1 Tax=Leucobacter chromiireducens subsp. chromiireducens TaxID=660067 RepID=A0ABS1SPS6_9MICO|nr:DUF4190 domain-containing protein [Leucobacter chromiireducens]MBL3689494.1 hypothetical protein [Leucobacter chromiireducens subsp. chromiireducens]